MVTDIKTSGNDFVKSVLALYRTAKYFREKEILAGKLLDSTLEAGRLISELADCSEKNKSKTAACASEQLSRALYLLSVMQNESIYSARRVQPVLKIANPLKETIESYIAEEQPAEQLVLPEAQPKQTGEQLRLPYNDGGFNDIYKG